MSVPGVPSPSGDLGAYFLTLCDFLNSTSVSVTSSSVVPISASPTDSGLDEVVPVELEATLPPLVISNSPDIVQDSPSPSTVPEDPLVTPVDETKTPDPIEVTSQDQLDDFDKASLNFTYSGFAFYPFHILVPVGFSAVKIAGVVQRVYLFKGADIFATLQADEPYDLAPDSPGTTTPNGNSVTLRPGIHRLTAELYFYFEKKK